MRRAVLLVALAWPACGRSDAGLDGTWIVGRYHAVDPATGPADVVGRYEFTADRRFVARFSYCDDTPDLVGVDHWVPHDDDAVFIGPVAPARSLNFPVLDVADALAIPGDGDTVIVELSTHDGPFGRLVLAPGAWCIDPDCAAPGNAHPCP